MKSKIFLSILLLFCVATAFAQTSTQFADGDFTFAGDISTDTCTIISYSGAGGAVNIPSISTETLKDSKGQVTGYRQYTVTSISFVGNRVSGAANQNITSVTIPNSINSIGDKAFWGCTGLSSVTIPNSVTSIGFSAFYFCEALTSITIPNSVISIGGGAFQYCHGLTSVTIPNLVTSIQASTFLGCTGLISVTIPNSVTSIEYAAFQSCTALTSVTFPNSVISIGDCAFSFCSNLTSVTIPNSVISIGGDAFQSCNALTSITIPNSVTFIGNSAFTCCNLTDVTVSWSTPLVLSTDIFCPNMRYNATLHVPCGTQNLYKAAPAYWTACFKTISDGGCTLEPYVDVSPPTTLNFKATGGQQTFIITSNTDWTVRSDMWWATVSPTSGSNNGTVTITAIANLSSSQQTATITITGKDVTGAKTISLTQDPPTLSVSPTSLDFSAAGEQKIFNITSNANWLVSSNASWITISPDSGSENGLVKVTAEPNTTTTQRTAIVYINVSGVNPQAISITQAAAYIPVLSVSPTSLNFATSGGQQTFTISSNTSWNIVSSDSSRFKVSPASGSSNGTVTVTVAANTATTQQTATITVYGTGVTPQTISITQDAAVPPTPTLTVSPISLNFASSGEQQTFTVTSNADWTISSSDSWLTVSPALGSNNGTVTVTAAENTATTQRTATITISGTGITAQTISVSQNVASIIPALSVSTTSLNFAASGENQAFSISSNTDWTVSSSDSWLTVSPALGSNDGTVTVTAAENTATTQRTATITISGTEVTPQTISVTQDAAAEVPTVVPDEAQTVGADGKGTITLNLSIPSDATLTGSFEITLPAGITLNEDSTVLSTELKANFFLAFTNEGNNTWLIEIKSNTLRSFTAVEYQKIMDITYIVADNVSKGTYEATIKNLDFIQDNGTPIKEDLLTVPINVERVATSIENIGNSLFYAHFINNMLKVESSQAETITIYSAAGVRLYSTNKDAGIIEIPFSSIPGSVYIIKGSVSGTIKVVK